MAHRVTASGDATASPPKDRPEPDLSQLPPIFVLPTRLTSEQLHVIEDRLLDHEASLTYDIFEARLVLSTANTKKRSEFELRQNKLWTTEVVKTRPMLKRKHFASSPSRKRTRKMPKRSTTSKTVPEEYSTTEDEDGYSDGCSKVHVSEDGGSVAETAEATQSMTIEDAATEDEASATDRRSPTLESKDTYFAPIEQVKATNTVLVVKMKWLEHCLQERKVLDLRPYVLYEGEPKDRPATPATPPRRSMHFQNLATLRSSPKSRHIFADRPDMGTSILERAMADAGAGSGRSQDAHYVAAPHGSRRMGHAGGPPVFNRTEPHHNPARLMVETTSEYEGDDMEMPPPPNWVKEGVKYSCQRSTLANGPNEAFIVELKKIRLARILTNDEIGVRAYNTSVAAIAAYPYKLVNYKEILRLPGCDVKIANLWIEWKNNNGKVRAAEEAGTDPILVNLNLFYEIWGVGATTAREFYFDKGWRDLNDVVEYGWNTLSRVQQIGVKYYDEFHQGIPRAEVEFIASKVGEHAVKVRDLGVELLVVGGYRRGKENSGDVDMIVSHRDIRKTANLVQDIVESLEQDQWITHTLLLSLTSTHRDQSTLPFKAQGVASHGAGFDTLDKALVVWQDPNYSRDPANPAAKNPNIHRRVDIIISPWRTVGCAVTGWSGGTTFQRDLRRLATHDKGWKFDSSGVRNRATGEVVELEGPEGVNGSMVDAEKAVFEGLGLIYREPWERCTG